MNQLFPVVKKPRSEEKKGKGGKGGKRQNPQPENPEEPVGDYSLAGTSKDCKKNQRHFYFARQNQRSY